MGLFGRNNKTEEEREKEDKVAKESTERETYLEGLENQKYLICPYCEKQINEDTQAAELYLDEARCASLVGCPHCKKVLGTTTDI